MLTGKNLPDFACIRSSLKLSWEQWNFTMASTKFYVCLFPALFCSPRGRGCYYWSQWYDADSPNSPPLNYDIEVVGYNIKTCRNRVAIDIGYANAPGQDLSVAMNGNIWFHQSFGLVCSNGVKRCRDYKVRFCCKRSLPWAIPAQLGQLSPS